MFGLFLPVCSLLAAAFLSAPPDERPTVRVDNYSVVVDVVVTDKRNSHVTDLKAEDFLVFEDGESQELETFQVISSDAGRRGRPTGVRANSAIPVERADSPRLIILLLDYATVEYLNQGYVREAAVRYVREQMVPGDLIAVFKVGSTLKFLQQFTDDKDEIVKALQARDLAGSAYASDQEILAENAQTSQDRSQLLASSIESIVSTSPNGPQGQQALVVETLNQFMLMAQRLEARYYAQLSFSRQQQSRPIIGAIETIARGVEHLQGRKTLIMFSQGFSVPLSLERAFYRSVHVANRSNLAVYAIDAGGLQFKQPKTEQELYDVSAARPGDRKIASAGISQFDRAREVGSDQKDSTLRYLTSATGGFVIRHTNDFLSALKRIDADARSHYLLSYRPRTTRFDGEFRTIKVEVKRPGIQVRARPGYWALPPGASLLSPEEYKRVTATENRARGESGGDKTFSLSSHCFHFLNGNGEHSVHLFVDLPLKHLVVQASEGRAFIELDAIGIVRNERGEVITSFRGPSRISTTPSRAAEVQTARFGTTLVLPPGKYSITVLVTDSASQRTAREERSLLLLPANDSLSVSSVCLGREAIRVSSGTTGPFSVDGSEIIVSSDRVFGPGDPLMCFFRIYRPGLAANQLELECDVSLILGGRVISRNGIPVEGKKIDSAPVPNLPVARYFSLEGLPAGPYILRVEARDRATGEKAYGQASFTLLPAGGKVGE